MKAKVVILPTGEISIVTQEGTFEGGQGKINALLAALNLEGLNIKLDKPMEQHRHDGPEGVHAHSHGGYTHSH